MRRSVGGCQPGWFLGEDSCRPERVPGVAGGKQL